MGINKSNCLIFSVAAVTCSDEPVLEYSKTLLTNGIPEYGDVRQFTCLHGYHAAGQGPQHKIINVTCSQDGTWQPAKAKCKGLYFKTYSSLAIYYHNILQRIDRLLNQI